MAVCRDHREKRMRERSIISQLGKAHLEAFDGRIVLNNSSRFSRLPFRLDSVNGDWALGSTS